MSEIFHGWRRRLGVATLIFACAMMAGWLRSISTLDVVTMPLGVTTVVQLASIDRHLILALDSGLDQGEAFNLPLWDSDGTSSLNQLLEDYRWTWRFCGVGTLEASTGHEVVGVIPYLSIIIPLTLLSLLLMVGKPRRSDGVAASSTESRSNLSGGIRDQTIPR